MEASRIRQYMEGNNVTIKDLSEKSGVAERFVKAIRSGAVENGKEYKENGRAYKKYIPILIEYIENDINVEKITREDIQEDTKLSEEELDNKIEKFNEAAEKLKKERIKLTLIRNAEDRKIRKEAKFELILEDLRSELQEIGKHRYIQKQNNFEISNNDVLVTVADWHIGQTIDSTYGYYNFEAAQRRVNEYYSKILDIKKRHTAENCHVVCLGDLIQGDIHQVFNRSNEFTINEQVRKAVELLSEFLEKLSENFKNVYVYGVVGNHSRRNPSKEDADINDNMDDQILEFVQMILKDVKNIKFSPHIHPTQSYFKIKNLNFLAIHGDKQKVNNAKNIYQLATQLLTIGKRVDIVLSGHLHHSSINEYNTVRSIQVGCLPGSGDDFTIEKSLTGRPSQTVLVINDEDIECIYTIYLK